LTFSRGSHKREDVLRVPVVCYKAGSEKILQAAQKNNILKYDK
jgi:hypothetical protein